MEGGEFCDMRNCKHVHDCKLAKLFEEFLNHVQDWKSGYELHSCQTASWRFSVRRLLSSFRANLVASTYRQGISRKTVTHKWTRKLLYACHASHWLFAQIRISQRFGRAGSVRDIGRKKNVRLEISSAGCINLEFPNIHMKPHTSVLKTEDLI